MQVRNSSVTSKEIKAWVFTIWDKEKWTVAASGFPCIMHKEGAVAHTQENGCVRSSGRINLEWCTKLSSWVTESEANSLTPWLWVMAVSEINCENILDEERSCQKTWNYDGQMKKTQTNLSSFKYWCQLKKKKPWAGLFLPIANPKAADCTWSIVLRVCCEIWFWIYQYASLYSKFQWLLGKGHNQLCAERTVELLLSIPRAFTLRRHLWHLSIDEILPNKPKSIPAW